MTEETFGRVAPNEGRSDGFLTNKGKWECSYCGDTFDSVLKLKRHYRNSHRSENPIKASKELKVDKTFDSKVTDDKGDSEVMFDLPLYKKRKPKPEAMIRDGDYGWKMWRLNIGLDKMEDALQRLREEKGVDLTNAELLRISKNKDKNYQIFWRPKVYKEGN